MYSQWSVVKLAETASPSTPPSPLVPATFGTVPMLCLSVPSGFMATMSNRSRRPRAGVCGDRGARPRDIARGVPGGHGVPVVGVGRQPGVGERGRRRVAGGAGGGADRRTVAQDGVAGDRDVVGGGRPGEG